MNWKCRHCHCSFEVPHGTPMQFCPQCGTKSKNHPQTQHSYEKNIQPGTTNCPVCCTEIQPDDEKIVCPDCKMPYHEDCWNDNNGCATYGCHSAGCLDPPPFKVNVPADNDSTIHTVCSTPTSGGICPKCHARLVAGNTFCRSCGNEFKTTDWRSEIYSGLLFCIIVVVVSITFCIAVIGGGITGFIITILVFVGVIIFISTKVKT